jgi:hypothetical protein
MPARSGGNRHHQAETGAIRRTGSLLRRRGDAEPDMVHTASAANLSGSGFTKGATGEWKLYCAYYAPWVAWHEAAHWWCQFVDGSLECDPEMDEKDAVEELLQECRTPPNRLIPEE